MKTLELEVGHVLRGDDLAEWEVLHPNMQGDIAWEWMRSTIPNRFPCFDWDRFASMLPMWKNHTGIVVYVPRRDLGMALAIRRRGNAFELIGRRETTLKK